MNRFILLADDNPQRANHIKQLLQPRGYNVEVTNTGVDCVARLRRARPDVLLLDADLLWGGSDGVLAWLGEESSRHIPPVLMIGANPVERFPRLAGNVRWLPARFSAELLLNSLNEACAARAR